MYGRDLVQETFLENVYCDIVKTFYQHFASYYNLSNGVGMWQCLQKAPSVLI